MNVVVASHISDLAGPTEALLAYLYKGKGRIRAILNPLEYCELKVRSVTDRIGGRVRSRNLLNLKKPAFVSWMLDIFFVFYFTAQFPGNIDIFIGCDPLNAIVGAFFKKRGKIKKLVYYSVDWSQKRFGSNLLNRIYYALDDLCVKICDVNWCVAESLMAVRRKKGTAERKLYYLPVGLTMPQTPGKENDKNALVFLGALEKTKGIELVIESWNMITKAIPKARLIVIGKTPSSIKRKYEAELASLQRVEVKGVWSHDEILTKIPDYGIGLAPYSAARESVTRFADPSRIKDYLATGLPVITTSIPEISRRVSELKAGVVIEYNKKSFVRAIQTIIRQYPVYRRNALRLRKQYEWNILFKDAFSHVEKL